MLSLPSPVQLPLFAAKRCPKCDRDDLTTDDFYVKDKKTGRLFSWCKECHKRITQERVSANPQAHLEHVVRWQKAHPDKVKESRKRYLESHRDERLAYSREYEARPETRVRRAEYDQSESGRISDARYREKHATAIKAYNAAHYAIHKERLRAAAQADYQRKRAHYAALSSAWKKANKDKVNSYTHKRRYALRGTWTDVDWQRLKAQWDWRCALCGQQEITDGIILCFDHIVPVSRGGWNIISNAQPLCRRCNSKKHRRVLVVRR